MKRWIAAAVTAILVLALGQAPAVAAGEPWSITGSINGAKFRVEMPGRWNGTLVLFTHGYYPPEFPRERIYLSNAKQTEEWLIGHGYAVAGSDFKGNGIGFTMETGVRDQAALLDWFGKHIGRARRTIVNGQSMGAAISLLLSERHPHKVDGVATLCGEQDPNSTWNVSLDIGFAVRTLLAPGKDIDLVRFRNLDDAKNDAGKLQQAVRDALRSKEGKARLALAAAFGNIPGWFAAHEPPPDSFEREMAQLAMWIEGWVSGIGPLGRVELEQRAGGNPSWNVGIDYSRQLARSAGRDLVRRAYRQAPGADLRADLKRLAAAPRTAPDRRALAYMYRHAVPAGSTPVPVFTLHTLRDGGAPTEQERWYAGQVRRHGRPQLLRQAWADRGMHCAFSAAEEIVMLRTVLRRVESGRWPATSPARLRAEAGSLPAKYQQVLDIVTGKMKQMPPAFVPFTAPQPLRPS